MADKTDLKAWVYESVRLNGGNSTVLDVAKDIWREHSDELQRSGDLFYKWQYDMRWAATELRKEGKFGEGWTIK